MASLPSAHHGHPPSLSSVVPWYSRCLSIWRYQNLFTHSLITGTSEEGSCSSRRRSYRESTMAQYRDSSRSRLGHHWKKNESVEPEKLTLTAKRHLNVERMRATSRMMRRAWIVALPEL